MQKPTQLSFPFAEENQRLDERLEQLLKHRGPEALGRAFATLIGEEDR